MIRAWVLRGQRIDCHAVGRGRVGHHHAEAAGSGNDGGGWRCVTPKAACSKGLDGRADLNQFFQRADPDDAVAGKNGIENAIASGQSPGMRERRLLPRFRCADLQGDDRLFRLSGEGERRRQPARIATGFKAAKDHPGIGIAGQPGDRIAGLNIRFVAGGDEAGDSRPAISEHPHRRAADIPALGDDGNPTFERQRLFKRNGEGSDHALPDAHRPQAVRTHYAHTGSRGQGRDGALQLLAVRPAFGKAGAENDGRAHAATGGLFKNLQSRSAWNGDEG